MQSVLHPPATSTVPLENRTAAAEARATLGVPVRVQTPVLGLYSSAVFTLPMEFSPPATSTRPLISRVAVCPDRAAFILLVPVHVPCACAPVADKNKLIARSPSDAVMLRSSRIVSSIMRSD